MTNGREAGWYPDPAGKHELRWFDGSSWTDQISEGGTTATDPFFRPEAFTDDALAATRAVPVTTGATAAVPIAGPPPGPGSRRGLALVAIGAVVAIVAIAVGVLAVTGGDDEPEDVAAVETTTTEEATTTTTEATTTTSTLDDPTEVIGSTLASAVAELTAAGFEVDDVEVINTDVPDGQVLNAEELPDGTVQLTVARPPVTRFLETLSPIRVDGNLNGPTFNVSGTTFSHGVAADSCVEPHSIEYDLGRDFRRFQASGGLLDDVPAEARMRVEISLDGVIVQTSDVAFGEVIAIDIDVTAVLRLKITLTELVDTNDCPFFGFGDGRLLGVPSEVPPEPGD